MTFGPVARCTECGDEYDPVEYTTVPQDPDEPQFCSDACEMKHWDALDAEEAYRQSGMAAPLW